MLVEGLSPTSERNAGRFDESAANFESMQFEWEPRAEDLFRRLLLQLDRRERTDHESRAREAAETHARTHGVRRVSQDAAVVGFVKAGGTMMKSQVSNAMRRVGIDPRQYEEYF